MSKGNDQHQALENLFNSKIRVKVLKFLFRNYPINVDIWELSKRIQEPPDIVRKEFKILEKIGLIKRS